MSVHPMNLATGKLFGLDLANDSAVRLARLAHVLGSTRHAFRAE